MKTKQIKDRLQMLLMAFWLVIGGFTLAACGDDDDVDGGGGAPTSGLTMDNLVGTWKITQYKGVSYNKATGEILGEDNDTPEQDYIVFYTDGRVCYYEYSDRGAWDEEGKSKFIIESGRTKFFGGDFADAQIVSLSGNDMILKWKWSSSDSESDTSYEEVTVKLHRESKRTDVLTMGNDDPNSGGGDPTSGLTMDNFVGSWKVVQYKEVERDKVTGEILREGEEDRSGQDYIVFYADGRFCYYEYSDDIGVWDEEGKSKFIIESGSPKFFGGDFANVQIVSLSGNDMTLKWRWSSSDTTYENGYEEVTAKLHRETKRTDVLTIGNDWD